jgi:hypothetical protein
MKSNKFMKKFNFFSHQENANQNYLKIPSHPNQNGYHQENKQQYILVMMGAGGTLTHSSYGYKFV